MRCFNHPDVDAVATCKHCFKGVCKECVVDSGCGLACSLPCQDEIRSLYAMMNRSKKMYPLAARNQSRNAIWLVLTAAVFIASGLWIKADVPFMAFLIGMGC
jgi:hypothetical protein